MEPWKERVYATYGEHVPGKLSTDTQQQWAADRRDYIRRYRRWLPSERTARIVDLGCGTGSFVDALRSLGYQNVEGIDLSFSQVQAAVARGLPGISHSVAVDYLRERRDRFAVITAFSVLEHQTREELFELLDGIKNALQPGGTLVAVVPNAKGLFGAHVRFADITHESSFTPSSVVQICGVTGLRVIAIEEHGPIVHGVVSAARWAVWQVIRAGLRIARIAEGGHDPWPVFTQDLILVARRP